MQHLFTRHLVGDNQQRAITLAAADQRKAEPGIAGCRLDDRAAGLEMSVSLRGLDHGPCRPILDRAGRVCTFEFEKQAARSAVDPRHFHERRVANQVEDGGHDFLPRYALESLTFSPTPLSSGHK